MKAVYLEHYLTDSHVANFARQSFARLAENYTEEQNHALIRYLARGMQSKEWKAKLQEMFQLEGMGNDAAELKAHELAVYMRSIPEHWVPFGHPSISIRMQAPVPIARQLFKHKIGFVESEESRRYISSRPELYIPENFRRAAANIKQGSGEAMGNSSSWMAIYRNRCEEMINLYERAIEDGMCPEQARFMLPQGVEVNWVWTGSLYAFSQMANKRLDPHAQKECQLIAKEINDIIAPLYPVSWAALTQGDY